MYSLEEYQNKWYAKRIGTKYDDLEVVAIRYEDGRQIWTLRCMKCGAERETKNPEDYKKGRRKGICAECRKRESENRKRAERIGKEARKMLREDEKRSKIGNIYGSWEIIDYLPGSGYLTKCTVCGRERIRGYKDTESHTSLKCTCDNNEQKYYTKDWQGKKIGHLTILRYQGKPNRGFVCRCDCGNEVVRFPSVLLSTEVAYCSKTCPYFLEDYDGRAKTRIYNTWQGMKRRCFNKNDPGYGSYGGRGITICDEWMDFDTFREWAYSHGYTDELTIDRIDPDGNYEPSNCRWLTVSENSRNARPSYTLKERPREEIFINGVGKTMQEWCDEYGITKEAVKYRMKTLGMTFEDAVTTPKHQGYHK